MTDNKTPTDDCVIRPDAFAVDDGQGQGGETGREWRAVFIMQGCMPSQRITVFGNTAEIALEKAWDRAPQDCARIRIFAMTKAGERDGPYALARAARLRASGGEG